MKTDKQSKPLKSLGTLRKAKKTKPRSPDLTGQITVQRDTFEGICRDFKKGNGKSALCNIAAWRTKDYNGDKYLNVELSARFAPPKQKQDDGDIFDFLFDHDGDD